MKTLTLALALAGAVVARAEFKIDRAVMSDKYWAVWNDDVQREIDAAIEANRKADAEVALPVAAGTEVEVKQISHAFYFGAHIFNYNQLGSKEANARYKELYGTLFNSATVAFYWKTLEPYPHAPRFVGGVEDTEEWWNGRAEPWSYPHWRRPATDPVINFCKQKGVRIHGHPLAWGNNEWMFPQWIWDEYCPASERVALERTAGVKFPKTNSSLPVGQKDRAWCGKWREAWEQVFKTLPEDEVAKLVPTFFAKLNELTVARIREIAACYGERVDSWDVVNESAHDFHGQSITGKPFQISPRYGITAGDLAWTAFKTAKECLPARAWFNINDYANDANYVAQIRDLLANGAKIDVVGSQMHLFDLAESRRIAAGNIPSYLTPSGVRQRFDLLSQANRPIHLSEITITAPDMTPEGQMIQAIITRNLYRAWFAQKNMNGITWWNVVDGCGAPGEPSISGIFTRDMKPKTVYFALDDLINREWKTTLTVKAGDSGKIAFRGFRGTYELSWKDANGNTCTREIDVK